MTLLRNSHYFIIPSGSFWCHSRVDLRQTPHQIPENIYISSKRFCSLEFPTPSHNPIPLSQTSTHQNKAFSEYVKKEQLSTSTNSPPAIFATRKFQFIYRNICILLTFLKAHLTVINFHHFHFRVWSQNVQIP